jgi:hypothetical protein
MLAHTGQIDEAVNRAQQVVHGDVPVEVEAVEQGFCNIVRSPIIARSLRVANGLNQALRSRLKPSSAFFNTIGRKRLFWDRSEIDSEAYPARAAPRARASDTAGWTLSISASRFQTSSIRQTTTAAGAKRWLTGSRAPCPRCWIASATENTTSWSISRCSTSMAGRRWST